METNPHVSPELDEVALQQAKTWGLQIMRDVQAARRNEIAEMKKAYQRPAIIYG